MNWDALGAIAELAGAGGVIISLLYLAVQMRRQGSEIRFAAAQELVSHTNVFFGSIADTPDLANIWVKGNEDFDSLDKFERARFMGDITRAFRGIEGLIYLHLRGRLDPVVWKGLDKYIRDLCKCPGVRRFWTLRSQWYSDETNEYVSEYIADNSTENVLLGSYELSD